MKKQLVALGAVVFLVLVGLSWHWYEQTRLLNQLVGVSWGDGKYGKARYGVYVFYEEVSSEQVVVKARVYIGRPSVWMSYMDEVGTLGYAADPAEAVSRWGKVVWDDKGIVFGNGQDTYYLYPREKLENHR